MPLLHSGLWRGVSNKAGMFFVKKRYRFIYIANCSSKKGNMVHSKSVIIIFNLMDWMGEPETGTIYISTSQHIVAMV